MHFFSKNFANYATTLTFLDFSHQNLTLEPSQNNLIRFASRFNLVIESLLVSARVPTTNNAIGAERFRYSRGFGGGLHLIRSALGL